MSLFKSKDSSRLKAGWRILLFIFLFWIFAAAIFAVKPLLGDITKSEFLEGYRLIIVAILAFGATISVWIARKYLDKKSFVSLGLRTDKKTWQDLLFGFLLSAVMAGIFLVILLISDLAKFDGITLGTYEQSSEGFDYLEFMKVASIGSLSLLLLEHLLVGYWEELVFRGYVFQNMIEGMGLKISIVISCLIYGLIHITNPNAGLLSSLIIVAFGYLRIYGYLSTQQLWLSMGMHMGWNFFQGPIFGFAASGHQHATLFNVSFNSSKDWLTGGEFGPEGSILVIPILLLALWVMDKYAKRTRNHAQKSN